MTFDTLVWVVAAASVGVAALCFWLGKLWMFEYSNPPITPAGKVRKTTFGILMGFALFITLGAFTLMKPPLTFEWQKDHDKAFEVAKEQEKGAVFIDFWANWCQRCNEIERQTFNQDEFLKALDGYVPLKVDATDPDEETEALMEKYGVGELPTFILISADGKRQKVLDANTLGKGDQTAKISAELTAFAQGQDTGKKKGKFAQALGEGLGWALLAALLGGLVTAMTPCVYPMIPVTVSIIGSAGGGDRKKAFVASLVYVLGMALCYSALGVTVAAVGGQFAALFQNTFFLIAVAAMFLVLAAHMLEVRKLGFLARLNEKGGAASMGQAQQAEEKGLFPVFTMGILSGFVFAPCVGPVLLGVLTYIGESGDLLLGFVFMFTFAMGLGIPFMLLGTFAGMALARPGDWMVGVEAGFGAALVAAALYFLVPVIPALNEIFVKLGALATV